MTVAELKQALSKYPDDMEVKIVDAPALIPVTDIKTIVDIDTNITSLIMRGSRDWWIDEEGY
jgi:hypothetical protein